MSRKLSYLVSILAFLFLILLRFSLVRVNMQMIFASLLQSTIIIYWLSRLTLRIFGLYQWLQVRKVVSTLWLHIPLQVV